VGRAPGTHSVGCCVQLFIKIINCKRTNITLHQATNMEVSVENMRYRRAPKMLKMLNTQVVDIFEPNYNVIKGLNILCLLF